MILDIEEDLMNRYASSLPWLPIRLKMSLEIFLEERRSGDIQGLNLTHIPCAFQNTR